MGIPFKTRNLYADELRMLKILKAKNEKTKKRTIKYHHFIIAAVLGVGCTYITAIIPDSFWTFLLGTTAIFSFAFIVFTPFEIYKIKRRHRDFLQRLNATITAGTVNTCPIRTTRIALAEEYEDEGVLFIIEYETDSVLYIWDHDHTLRKKFPCLDFEIYEENFSMLLGRRIYALSERIKPVTIDKKAKWNYMAKKGVRGNLEIEKTSFDQLIEEYNNYATMS